MNMLGALLMAFFGLGAVLGIPLAFSIAVAQPILGKQRSGRWYAVLFGIPAVSLVLMIVTFVVRSLVGTFFEMPVG